MSGQGIQGNQNRKVLGWLLIVFGALLIAMGSMAYLSNGKSPSQGVADEGQSDAATSEVISEAATVEMTTAKPVPASFSGNDLTVKGVTVLMADGAVAKAADVPAFHGIASISAEPGINPKTNVASDTLRLAMPKAPDREMRVSVLVSRENPEISGKTPDAIEGTQWLLTYAGGQFKKTARRVASDGTVTELPSDHFNIRFDGNDGLPLIDFFGPPGTLYYGVMIEDGTYFTLILP